MSLRASPSIRAALGGHLPSDEQWRAISYGPVPLAIIAGAGSGKTAVMAARIVWMIEEGLYRPVQILGLTFTNKAAAELEERIHSALGEMDPPPAEHPPVATYHSFADRLVREYGVRIGIDPDVGMLSKAQAWQLLMGEFERLPPFDAVESRSMSTVIGTALGLADQCANLLVSPERVAEEDERIVEDADRFEDEMVRASRQRIEYARVVRAYLDAKRRARRIDFGDQVTQAVEILERFPEVAAELRERYPALLLDEYQDTNVAQRRLLQQMAPEGFNVTAVGDARQNIYQWRGSTLFNLIDFPTRHFLREGGSAHEYLPLSTNYRSGSKILDVANRVVEEIPEQRRPGNPLVPDPGNHTGAVKVKMLSDQYAEAEFIAEEIRSLHSERMHPDRDPTNWSDFAILVRRRSHIPVIYEALKDRDIPVEVVGLSGLLQVPEVMDAVAWLRVIADPGPPGNRWLARILLGPRFRVHYRDLALLARWAAEHTLGLARDREVGESPGGKDSERIVSDTTKLEPDEVAYSLAEALDHLDEIPSLGPEARRRLGLARAEIQSLRPRANGPLLELVQAVVIEAGIWEALDASIREDAEAAKRNLTNFLGVVANFEPVTGEPSLGAFLAYLDAAEDVEETLELATEVVGDSVKLTTIHQAKGLEFEVVFIPCVAARTNDQEEYVDSIFPDVRSSNPMTSYGQLPFGVREDAPHLPNPWRVDAQGTPVPKRKLDFRKELAERAIEDERRLFYVALTRAKQRLYVTAAWWYERQQKERGPSQFFDEVGGVPGVELLPGDAKPDESPLLELLEGRAIWPPSGRTIGGDELFPQGYPAALDALLEGSTSADDLMSTLDPEAAARALRILDGHRKTLEALERVRAEPSVSAGRVQSISVTRAVDLAGGRIAVQQVLRPLPERPTAARRLGTEIHRWIEEQGRGLSGLADEEALDAPASHVERSRIAKLRAAFKKMGFEARTPARLDGGEPMAEMPFVLKVGGWLIRGRVDAVYPTPDGGLEIVDFKSGEEYESPDLDQLLVYAAALVKLGVTPRGPLRLTYAYLSKGKTTEPREISPEEALSALSELETRLDAALKP